MSELIDSGEPRKQWTVANGEAEEMRQAYNVCLKRLKTVCPDYKFNKRSNAVMLDKHLTRFSNELRRLASEFDDAQNT